MERSDQQCSCTQFDKRRECSLQLPIVSSVRKLYLPTDCASRLLYIPHLGFMSLIVRIYKRAKNRCIRRQLLQQAQPLPLWRLGQQANARGVSAWVAYAGNQTESNWVASDSENDRNRRGRRLGRKCRRFATSRYEHRTRSAASSGRRSY